MGEKKKSIIRVVLDTNVLVSAMLFDGPLSQFTKLWKKYTILPLVSQETFEELLTVLSYPKFSLSEIEIEGILRHEVLPYFEVVSDLKDTKIKCRDPEDEKFISCAISGSARFLVTGDQDLLVLKAIESVGIISPKVFLKLCEA